MDSLESKFSRKKARANLTESGWSKTVFEQARQRFMDHYKKYLADHSNDWSIMSLEHQNLIGLATQLWRTGDYKDLLVVRDYLQPYLDLQGYWPESIDLNEWAISAAKAIGDDVSAARFTHDRGDILHQTGDYTQAEKLYKISEDVYLTLGNIEMALHSRHMRSLVVRALGRLSEAEQLCQATIDEAESIGLSIWIAHPLYVRGLIARDLGDYHKAKYFVEKSLMLLSGTGETAVIAQCHHFLGELALMEGDLDSARSHLEKSLNLSRRVGILRRVAATTRLIGDLAREEFDYDLAEHFYNEASEISMRIGDRPELAKVLISKAKVHILLRDEERAIQFFTHANWIYEEIGDPRGSALALYFLFWLNTKRGEPITAAKCAINAAHAAWRANLFKPRYLINYIRRYVMNRD